MYVYRSKLEFSELFGYLLCDYGNCMFGSDYRALHKSLVDYFDSHHAIIICDSSADLIKK